MAFLMIAMNQKMAIFVLGLALAITAALAIAPVASELAYACNGSSGKGGTGTKGSTSPIKPCVPGECPTTPAGV
jgi:hypothetical protein